MAILRLGGLILTIVLAAWNGTTCAAENLLLNSQFSFHAFDSSRTGTPGTYRSGSVPCWNTDAYGDVEVWRSTRAPQLRPPRPTDGVVKLRPGKRFSQFMLLCEVGLDHGDQVSLQVFGRQSRPGALQAAVHCLRLDNQPGTFSNPPDARVFPKHSRGELVRGPSYTSGANAAGDVVVKVERATIVGKFTESADASNDEPNTIGLLIEFTNTSTDDVWFYSPTLCRGPKAQGNLADARATPELYRSIPRTMQKLWRGEPLHIIVMGSSIDRGSANPRLVLYDEDPQSSTFKQALTGSDFDGEKIGRPEWNDYIGWWQHHFMYGGRLRQLLMQKFDYPIDKLLLNTMACDGSSVGESHSGLAEYAELRVRPNPAANGHREGKSWRELYPTVFARAEGARPDLVVFGSGANEHIDGPDEVAVFEGAIRWFQRHYPETEFVFCMWQNREAYSPNPPHLDELALRYQIPLVDLGRTLSLTTRHCNSYALCPKDGHPQAAGHYLWAKQLEQVFDAPGPIRSGLAQLQLPERISPQSISWEAEMTTYDAGHSRLRGKTAVILDDTVVNLWAKTKSELVTIVVDGATMPNQRRPSPRRDTRNSTVALGRLTLGDRHIVEVTGDGVELVAVDMKTALNRRWYGVENPLWSGQSALQPQASGASASKAAEPFTSSWGAPFGNQQRMLKPGESIEIIAPATDLSVAFADDPAGGELLITVDEADALKLATNQPFVMANGEKVFGENRRGIRGLPYGLHLVRVTAQGDNVRLLGLFAYDTRANRNHERVLRGYASPGERIDFATPFKARPLVFTTGGLNVERVTEIRPERVTFGGSAAGGYEIIGE
ncbi:MAG: SGNH/GDSL hydrolase family protein [Planctomycetes bacterium]|nr:SGNH/GDSL hydrolase family protein [Planctomycetota bacterium]